MLRSSGTLDGGFADANGRARLAGKSGSAGWSLDRVVLLRNLQADEDPTSIGSAPDREFIGLADVVALFRRYMWSILACVAVAGFLAWCIAVTTEPSYSARTEILIEPKLPQYLLQETGGVNTALDTAQIESQITVMRSEKIAKMVIDDLDLMQNPQFMVPPPSPTKRLALVVSILLGKPHQPASTLPAASEPPPPAVDPALAAFERERNAIATFQSNLDIRRVGVSYAVDIFASSPNPGLAADIANATANTFVREQIETKAAAAREGGDWMERRLGELRRQMNTATQIAQQFRARHDYKVRPPGATIENGQLVYDKDAVQDPQGPTLEELELTADTYRKMYESFLQAYTSNLSQQSYLVADARVITAATRPLAPTRPRVKLVLVFGLFAGAILGTGLALLRNIMDRSVRSPRQIAEELGLECLGQLPMVRGRNGGFGGFDEIRAAPKSAFSTNLRRAKSAIGLRAARHPVRTIGLVSALPGEGKSICASNLALLYATAGLRTLLVDADVEYAVASNALSLPAPNRQDTGATPPVESGRHGLDLVPASTAESMGLLSVTSLEAALPDLRTYGMAIFDLPAMTAGADMLAITSLLDGVVVVVEWSSTPIDLVQDLVWTLQGGKTAILGVLLTRVGTISNRPYRHGRFRKPR